MPIEVIEEETPTQRQLTGACDSLIREQIPTYTEELLEHLRQCGEDELVAIGVRVTRVDTEAGTIGSVLQVKVMRLTLATVREHEPHVQTILANRELAIQAGKHLVWGMVFDEQTHRKAICYLVTVHVAARTLDLGRAPIADAHLRPSTAFPRLGPLPRLPLDLGEVPSLLGRGTLDELDEVMASAQAKQEHLQQVLDQLAERSVEVAVGGGRVVAVVSGARKLLRLEIAPGVPAEELPGLVVAAVNAGLDQMQALVQAEMRRAALAVGLPLDFQ